MLYAMAIANADDILNCKMELTPGLLNKIKIQRGQAVNCLAELSLWLKSIWKPLKNCDSKRSHKIKYNIYSKMYVANRAIYLLNCRTKWPGVCTVVLNFRSEFISWFLNQTIFTNSVRFSFGFRSKDIWLKFWNKNASNTGSVAFIIEFQLNNK